MTEPIRRVGVTSWCSSAPDPPQPYREPAGLVLLPATPEPGQPKQTRRTGHPDCIDCTLGETGCCGRHSYDILRSVAGAARPSHEARLERTFRDAFSGDW
jgi:hypothetical protein